jgi:hypothetical protein
MLSKNFLDAFANESSSLIGSPTLKFIREAIEISSMEAVYRRSSVQQEFCIFLFENLFPCHFHPRPFIPKGEKTRDAKSQRGLLSAIAFVHVSDQHHKDSILPRANGEIKADHYWMTDLGYGSWVEEGEVVVEAPVVGPGLFVAAGYFQDEVEDLPAHLLDGGLAGGDGAGVDVDEVGPALG